MPNRLEVKNLSVTYATSKVLENIHFEVQQGDILAVMGPNGSGKTTLFRAILNMTGYSGKIQLNMKSVNSKSISYMPQNEHLDYNFPITVEEVVKMGLFSNNSNEDALENILDLLELTPLRSTPIAKLSGGQRKRMFLGRALVKNTDILLLDEPTNEIDIATNQIIFKCFKKLAKQGKILLIATHELDIAMQFASHTLLLDNRQIAFGKSKEVCNMDNLRKTFGKHVIFDINHNLVVSDHHAH